MNNIFSILKSLSLRGDKVIWAIIVLLSFVSLLVVYSSTGTLAYKYQGGNTSYYFIKQVLLLGACGVIIIIVHAVPVRLYSKFANLGLLISVGLLIMAKFMGTSLNDASRWLTIPGIGFNFQPSEIAKLALILHLARTLSRNQTDKYCKTEVFWKLLIPIIVVCFFIFLEDFSTAAMLGLVSFMLLFIGRVRTKYLLGSMALGLVVISFIIAMAPYLPNMGRIQTVHGRIERYISQTGSNDANFQVEQAKIAVATGGITGKGPGNSTQSNFLPHPYSDFIYAIIVEEAGWIGTFIIPILYLFLLFRAGLIVKQCSSTFPAFLVIGLTLCIVMQALINMGVSVSILPVTGQPLPLVSMGGTSLIFTSIALGMILNVSASVKKEENNE